jgi:hypothetical protein
MDVLQAPIHLQGTVIHYTVRMYGTYVRYGCTVRMYGTFRLHDYLSSCNEPRKEVRVRICNDRSDGSYLS